MRKTIHVSDLKNRINDMLQQSISYEEKRALCVLIEDVLFDTDNYHGFKWNLPLEQAKKVAPNDQAYFDRTYF